MSTSDVSFITRGVEAMDVDKRERAREKLKKINETLTFEKMWAASPLDELPYYYYPDFALNHFPPRWYLGILVTIDDVWNFALKHNLVATPSNDPSEEDRWNTMGAVRRYLYKTYQIKAACSAIICSATIEFVYADTSTNHFICISLCSNYGVHLCPDDALDNMEARLLELWDFMGPRISWYLDALGDSSEPTEWPLDFYRLWEQKYGGKEISSV
ncbi:hypothetical protein BDZ89DRAFT_1061930 [Hymenopellis radicata]|nr:hypothetical protein BDZ89DRAFT_1061930 [Hymenopellis radicata]